MNAFIQLGHTTLIKGDIKNILFLSKVTFIQGVYMSANAIQ